MRYAITFVGLLSLGSLGLYACGSTTATPVTDAGSDAPVTKPDTGAPKPDAGPDASDEGSSCAKAIAVALGDQTQGNLNSLGKSLYYSVPVTKGDFLLFSASTAATTDTEPGAIVDATISVYDSTGAKLLATVDDAYPRITTDTEFFYRAPETATLCVQVTDFDTWKGASKEVAPDSAFTLLVDKIAPEAEVMTFDTEPNETTAAAQTGKLKAFTSGPGGYTYLAGALDGASDVDTYKFTVPTDAVSINVTVPPIGAPLTKGSSSYGSTLPRFTATVKKLDGTIVAELAPPTGQVESMADSLSAPVAAGDYYLVISRPTGIAAGTNDFYATMVQFGTGNPVEKETLSGHTNDTPEAAEALTMTADTTNAKVKHGYILAYLPAGDVNDHFSFAVGANDSVAVACGAARNGSGLQSFKVDLLVGGTSKQSEVETATADLLWATGTTASKAPVVMASAGTAVLKFSASGNSTTNTGAYYLCGVHVTSP